MSKLVVSASADRAKAMKPPNKLHGRKVRLQQSVRTFRSD